MDGFFKGCGVVVLSVMLFVIVVVGGYGLAAGDLMFWQPWKADKQTEIIRNTNQYVKTQQDKIDSALREFNDNDTNITFYSGTPENATLVDQLKANQVLNVKDMCSAANLIEPKYVPEAAKPLMLRVGCWNP